MGRISLIASVLFFFFILGGCAAQDCSRRSEAAFPACPATILAKTPEQSTARGGIRQNYTMLGGWGYNKGDAFILRVPHGRARKNYNNTIPLESLLVQTRNDVEFLETPTTGERYVVVDHGKVARTVSYHQGRMYAVWRADMCVLSEKEFPRLFSEAVRRPLPQRATVEARANSRRVPREYWFDVTDTFALKEGSRKIPTEINWPEGMSRSAAELLRVFSN